jgi:hypothetical protein
MGRQGMRCIVVSESCATRETYGRDGRSPALDGLQAVSYAIGL